MLIYTLCIHYIWMSLMKMLEVIYAIIIMCMKEMMYTYIILCIHASCIMLACSS